MNYDLTISTVLGIFFSLRSSIHGMVEGKQFATSSGLGPKCCFLGFLWEESVAMKDINTGFIVHDRGLSFVGAVPHLFPRAANLTQTDA